jgi:hypothetical protein
LAKSFVEIKEVSAAIVPLVVIVPPVNPVPAVILVTVPVPPAVDAMVIVESAPVSVILEPATSFLNCNSLPTSSRKTPSPVAFTLRAVVASGAELVIIKSPLALVVLMPVPAVIANNGKRHA